MSLMLQWSRLWTMAVSSQGNRLVVGWLLWPIIPTGQYPMVLVVVRLTGGLVNSCHKELAVLVTMLVVFTGLSLVITYNKTEAVGSMDGHFMINRYWNASRKGREPANVCLRRSMLNSLSSSP